MQPVLGDDGDVLPVLHVIDTLGGGGAEMALAELLPGLHRRGIRSHVACLRRSDEGVEPRVATVGVEVSHLPDRGPWVRTKALRQLIVTTRARVVHTALFHATVTGQLACIGLDVPVVTSLVNDTYGPARYADPAIRPWRLGVVQAVDGLLGRHLTDQFHAITYAVRDAAVDQLRLPPDRIHVVSRGHDPARLGVRDRDRRLRSREALGLPPDAPIVVTTGRHEYQKGQVHLLDAVARLATSHQDVHLLVLGRRGARTRALESQRDRLGLQDRVHLLGYRSDAPDVLAAGDVFAFPSLYEGLGNALIEAMALALPIVASDLPAVREVVGRGPALLVPPSDPAALAAGLGQVLDDEGLRTSMAAAGRARFLDTFTIDRVADEMAALFHSVANEAALTPGAVT